MTRKLSVSFFHLLCTSAKSFRSEACLRSKIASLKTSTNGPVHLFYLRDIESFEGIRNTIFNRGEVRDQQHLKKVEPLMSLKGGDVIK